jgi:hypothetical protein
MGGELPEHSVISCLYDTVGASNGWRSPADTTKIMRLKYGISPVNKSTDDDLTVAIVVGYLLVKRVIAWKIVLGDYVGIDRVVDIMGQCAGYGNTGSQPCIDEILRHIDSLCEYIENNNKIDQMLSAELAENLIPRDLTNVHGQEELYGILSEAVRAVLSDGKETCRLCTNELGNHEHIEVTIESAQNEIVHVRCQTHEMHHDSYVDQHKYGSGTGNAKQFEANEENVKSKLNALIDKLKVGSLNQYVTDDNTCYLSGQRGKLIMPIMMDTFILRMCGKDNYMGEGRKLTMFHDYVPRMGQQ